MKRIILITAICTALSTGLHAQHEVSVYGKAGVSSMKMELNQATSGGSSFSGGAGLSYTLSLNSKWGITTGVESASFSSTVDAGNISKSSQLNYSYDGRTESMVFNSELRGYKETVKATYLQIPLMAQFSLPVMTKHKWYAAAGVKLGFSISGSYETTAQSLVTSGYFPRTEETLTDLPQHGFVNQSNISWDEDTDFGFNPSLSIETGLRWALSDNFGLYTGVYMDYGLIDVSSSSKNKEIVKYENAKVPETLSYNSILSSKPQAGVVFVDKINLFSIGLKVKIAFGKSKKIEETKTE
jgi:hypothetical protein